MLIRSSFIGTAQRCVAEAYYKYYLGLQPKGSKQNKDLFFGKAVHRAIEIALHNNVDEAVEYLDSLMWPPSPGKKSKSNAIILTRAFSRWFPYELVDTEVEHEVKVGGHIWRGRFDVIAKKDGLIFIDNKTTNSNYLLIRPNMQFSGYAKAAKELYPDYSRFEVINLDPEMLEVTAYPFRMTDEMQEEWEQELIKFVDYVEDCFTSGIVPKSDSQCIRFGRYMCPYYDLCTSTKTIKEKVIENCYEVSQEQKELAW